MAKSAVRKALTTERRSSVFKPETLDEEERTVWAVAATETPVKRYFGNEVLKCNRAAIDAGRLNALPVIDSHDSSSILNMLGQVVEWKFEGRSLLTKIMFADSERGRAAFDLVRSGMLHKVSVGYRIHDYDEARASDGSMLVTATLWEPIEVSLVAVPADVNSTLRGMTMAKATTRRRAPSRDQIDDQRNEDMSGDDLNNIDDEEDDERRISAPNLKLQRHIDEQIAYGVKSGLRHEDLEAACSRAGSRDEARGIVWDMIVEKQNRTSMRAFHGNNSDDLNRSGLAYQEHYVEAITARLTGRSVAEGNPLRNSSMVEIGRRYLDASGVSLRGWGDNEVASFLIEGRGSPHDFGKRAHTTSDFPQLLVSAANRALLERYAPMISPLKRLSHKRDAKDFRRQTFFRPGEAPRLQKVTEHGEVTHGTLNESGQGLKIDTYAKIFGLTRQALINDDLGAFTDFLSAFAQSSAETEGDLLFELLSANAFGGAMMDDGKTLFHVDRMNKAAEGATISEGTIHEARIAMRLQKNINGTGTAGVTPAVLLVGPRMETAAEKFVASVSATNTADVNPFAGKLRVEVENRHEGNGWWLFADPQQRPALVHGYLSGSEGPQVETQNGWDVLGTQFRCILDFGCAPFDFRAAYFNPGL